jgi:predicted DNA-binding transcriptional regulator YafY
VLDASARLLRLLTLLQARPTWSGVDLADRLEITPRTLRRDVDRLRSLGYPVESTAGAAGGYKLGEGASLPPLHLDEEEATAVFVGLYTAAGTGVADTAALRALSKLERVLPARVKRRLATLRASVLKLADRTPAISLADVATLAVACSERLVTRFAYAGQGGPTDREVEPLRIVHVGRRWYLVGWDVPKQAWRTFRVDRIRQPETTKERFAARNPPENDLVRYVTESLSQSPYKYRAKVLLHSPAEPLREHVTAYEGMLTRVSEDRCILQTGARSLEAVALFVAMLGVDFEVIEPVELVLATKQLCARLARVKMQESIATGE